MWLSDLYRLRCAIALFCSVWIRVLFVLFLYCVVLLNSVCSEKVSFFGMIAKWRSAEVTVENHLGRVQTCWSLIVPSARREKIQVLFKCGLFCSFGLCAGSSYSLFSLLLYWQLPCDSVRDTHMYFVHSKNGLDLQSIYRGILFLHSWRTIHTISLPLIDSTTIHISVLTAPR